MNESGRRVGTRAAWRRVSSFAVGCAAVVTIGMTACAVGSGRGESGLRSAAAEPLRPGQVFRDCEECPEMVVVPAGTLDPDLTVTVHLELEPEAHVTIPEPFVIGVYEVTFAEWDACARGSGCGGWIPGDEGWGRADRPVVNVSWDDAVAYTRWLSARTGREYWLPQGTEWDYAARAGTETARYWGEDESGQCRHANGADTAYMSADPDPYRRLARCDDGHAYTAPVGSYEPNAWGLHDVLGNVWEWTAECLNGNLTGNPVSGSARRSGACSLRGGSWVDSPGYLRAANTLLTRVGWSTFGGFRSARTGIRDVSYGFRVARTVN